MIKVNGGELLLITLNNASLHDYQTKGSSFISRFCATLNDVIFIALAFNVMPIHIRACASS